MYVCICVCDIITMPYVLQECNWSCKMFVFGAYVCDIIPCHMSYRGATEYAECMCLVRMCVWYHNRVMCPAGVQLIATAHGNVLENVIKNPSLADLGECVCMWARVCVCLCERLDTHTHTHTQRHTCTHTYTHTQRHTCTHIHSLHSLSHTHQTTTHRTAMRMKTWCFWLQ
jgi:hypothetical protein